MSLKLTPDMLAAAYDFLRTTEPFKPWKLPESDDIGFSVIGTPHYHGDTLYDDCNPAITPVVKISSAKNGHTNTMLATMAHEMIHLRQWQIKDSGNHNVFFKRCAARVCRAHGFDPKVF